MKKHLPLLLMIIACTMYGLSLLFTTYVLDALQGDIFRLLTFRFGAVVLCMTVMRMLGLIKVDLKGKPLAPLFGMAVLFPTLYFIGESLGVVYAPSSLAGVMLSVIPVLTTLFGFIFLGEKPGFWQVVLIFISVIGVLIINSAASAVGGSQIWLGTLLMLGALLSASFYNILLRRYGAKYGNMELTYSLSLLAFAVFAVVSLGQHVVGGTLASYFAGTGSLRFWGSIFFLSVMCSVVALSMMNYAATRLPVVVSSSLAGLSTVVAILAGVLLLGEPFGPGDALGSLLIIGAVLGINLLQNRQREKAEEPRPGAAANRPPGKNG